MNKGALPILARLQRLQVRSRFAQGKARIVADARDNAPVAHILRATNETVLGRSLQFSSSTGQSLTLDVAGRRILRVTDASDVPGAERYLGLDALEDEHKDELIKLLLAVAQPGHELRVTSGPIGRGGEAVSVGLPVALLADLLLVDLNEAGTDDAPPVDDADVHLSPQLAPSAPAPSEISTDASLASFAASIGAELVAWHISGGSDDRRSSGPEEMVSHLQSFLDDERRSVDHQLDLLSSSPEDPVAVLLGVTLIDGHSIICARLDGGMLLGVVEGDGTRRALAAWRGLIG